ncbi:MAG: hypothetical protein BGO90_02400 [Legionella sp. 40-6]|nr:hypothetical protein [Legionella sp.]OJY07271.1 MAG: hypothetical protein BGO90_02400 [Legionella sp. 40-6]
MLIEPTQPIYVKVKSGHDEYTCQLVSLSDTELELKGDFYMEKASSISFLGKYFRGRATINDINFLQPDFIYHLIIDEIQFQPGLLIDTEL